MTPEEEAIATMRARDPDGWAPVSDEQIAKLAQTQWLEFGIAVRRLGRAIAARIRPARRTGITVSVIIDGEECPGWTLRAGQFIVGTDYDYGARHIRVMVEPRQCRP